VLGGRICLRLAVILGNFGVGEHLVVLVFAGRVDDLRVGALLAEFEGLLPGEFVLALGVGVAEAAALRPGGQVVGVLARVLELVAPPVRLQQLALHLQFALLLGGGLLGALSGLPALREVVLLQL